MTGVARQRTAYERMKTAARARNVALAIAGRDIGELPSVVDPARKDRAARDFQAFCEAYFPAVFYLPWSADHLRVLRKIEQAVLHGGLFAMAMPRGSGKTTLCECACLWALLYGHRQFVALIGASELHAIEMLESIKTELDGNERLLEDFPEVIYPIRALDGIANRCSGQLYHGARTHIGWTANEVILPTIPGSQASGGIIRVAGITGRIRGMKHTRPDGSTVRPSLVVIDDPQTDESARSFSQCAKRERILVGAILGLAGPRQKIAAIMPCTVIRRGDVADVFLDRNQHPDWNGERTKLLYSFPTNEKLWQQYAELRAESFRRGGRGEEATEFYRQHRAEMDEGAVVAWPERFYADELSAIQHAMNLKLQDEVAFFAEYQNEPRPVESAPEEDLTADQIASKLSGLARGHVPIGCNHVTAFVDVHANILYWLVVAWADDYTGSIIDYGTYPEQKLAYFSARNAPYTLQRAAKGAQPEGAIHAGLEAVAEKLLGRSWEREDGAQMHIERCLIDANWGQATELVYQFCRQSRHAAVLLPSHGRFVGASSRPLNDYQRRPGDRCGLHWRIPALHGRLVRHCVYDTNFWKSFVHARLATPIGDRGCLTLFGATPAKHRLLAEHLTAEYRITTTARGRTVDEWRLRPERADNHWWDCLVGAAVAASVQGVTLPGRFAPSEARRQRLSFAALQQARYHRHG